MQGGGEWWQLMAGFSANWAWLGSPGEPVCSSPCDFPERRTWGGFGGASGVLGLLALERPRLKRLLVLHSC